ncbi:hypothetical protein IFM89_037419 [Coptis chinensis]|uniref:Uncharacterized protein n=1 Tax=Coptis chinensis TaxID=261450 RepID=A0A835IYV6_9MAGN|nr:hypothetical protein IFM89_037419 [Coptis chinensis]
MISVPGCRVSVARLHGICLDFGLNLLGFLGSIKNFFLSPNFGYKGLVFACVGFAASLFGTAISNGLIMLRKKMDPNIETPSKAPPTILNALTWSAQMDLSSNLKCQILNGIEIVLAKGVSVVFKGWVVILRSLNNVLGGVLFFTLARLTGLQKVLNNGKMDSEEDEKSDHIDETLKSG